jgi:hypothetical protein
MREKTIASAAAYRSAKPLVIVALLNVMALAAWLFR